MNSLAIIGSGIAGLGLAYYLRNQYQVTIYEKNSHIGGHSNTVDITEDEKSIPIDTGFMVFNRQTYPHLLRLFSELKVPTKMTDMSFSVQNISKQLEFAGASFNRLFGDRKNLLNLQFWKMLMEINRFNSEASENLFNAKYANMSLLNYVKARNYGDDFLNCYLIPMSSAIWSTPAEKIINFPAVTLLRFFYNHGLLGTANQHQWWTVEGGAKEYVKRIVSALPSIPRIDSEVIEVSRAADRVYVITSSGNCQSYDKVVLACHADEALNILREPLEAERRLLGAFLYQPNEALLHTDINVMPRNKRCWASWNYRLDQHSNSTHYWMNSLQAVSKKKNYFVTLNGNKIVDERQILKRIIYHHPLFDSKAIKAQEQLMDDLIYNSHQNQVFFCGSYFGYGFHEDALSSSLKLAEYLSGGVLCH